MVAGQRDELVRLFRRLEHATRDQAAGFARCSRSSDMRLIRRSDHRNSAAC